MSFRRLQTKILAGYIMVVMIFAAIAGVSYFQLKGMERQVNQLIDVEFTFYQINQRLAFNLAERASLGRAYMLYGKVQYVEDFDRLTEQSIELENKLLSLSNSEEEKDMVARSVAWGKAVKNELFAAVERGNATEINQIGAKIAPETQALIKVNSDLADMREQNIVALTDQIKQVQDRMILILFVSTGVAIVLAMGLGLFLSRSITNPIAKLVQVAEAVTDGNLDVEIEVKGRDEVAELAGVFRSMADNLNEVMSSINSAAEQVAAGSKQVSDSSIALSQGATEQASAIEQLTASLEEISAQTRQNAQNAAQANGLAEGVKGSADQGAQQMKGMLKAMDEINESSSNISKIIKVIDEIAFQTNILALNAAVEAARAGQHGKGFAVVAEEVRNLAARSANAAKETTDLIEGSIKKVEGGTRIANETAEALQQIVGGVSQVANLVGEIATASNEQSAGIEQISQGVAQVSSVVQTNSATSEESAAASEELAGQAEMLKDQVSRFRLKNSRRQISPYRGSEDSDPLMRSLEQMNRGRLPRLGDASQEAAVAGPRKIALSDREFGKY